MSASNNRGSVLDADAPLEPVIEEGQAKKSSKIGQGKRKPNFQPKELEYLSMAHVNVSLNSVKGADQAVSVFWDQVHEKFLELFDGNDALKPFWSLRDANSLMNQFQRNISKGVSNFNRFYKQAKTVEKTGWGEKEHIEAAMDKFLEETGRPFKCGQCVEILHAIPKFCPAAQDAEEEQADCNAFGTAMGSELERPQGQKAAKAAKK